MKNLFTTLLLLIGCTTSLTAQTDTKHFTCQISETGSTYFFPKQETNEILKKGEGLLDLSAYHGNLNWHQDNEVKPFQELINNRTFTKQRMQELEKGENIRIKSYFDETGIVKYVCFWLPKGKKTLLTDEEMYAIYKQYKGIKYDISKAKVIKTETGLKNRFYVSILFGIPFEDLKY